MLEQEYKVTIYLSGGINVDSDYSRDETERLQKAIDDNTTWLVIKDKSGKTRIINKMQITVVSIMPI